MEESKITPPHASMTLTVSRHSLLSPGTEMKMELHGCKECLTQALAKMFLADQSVKELFNKAVRIANERRAQKEN